MRVFLLLLAGAWAEELRVALFTAVVHVPDYHVEHKSGGGARMVRDALKLACSLDWVHSRLERHVITSGLAPTLEAKLAKRWVVHNETARTPELRAAFHWRAEAAKKRNDGWATYFKFLMWEHEEFDRIIFFDADCSLHGKPETWVQSFVAQHPTLHFLACRAAGDFNTHVMLLKPAKSTARELIEKADAGDFRAWTNTEQDVLSGYFPLEGVALKFRIQSREPPMPKELAHAGRFCVGIAHCHASIKPCNQNEQPRLDYFDPRHQWNYAQREGDVAQIPDGKCLATADQEMRDRR